MAMRRLVDSGLTITVIDSEADYVAVSLAASNGRFCGSIRRIYTSPGELTGVADTLAGFPSSATDVRALRLGDDDSSGVTGAAALEFRAADASGHAVLRVEIATADWTGVTAGPVDERVGFSVAIDPASVDRFVQQLRALDSGRSGVARLESHS